MWCKILEQQHFNPTITYTNEGNEANSLARNALAVGRQNHCCTCTLWRVTFVWHCATTISAGSAGLTSFIHIMTWHDSKFQRHLAVFWTNNNYCTIFKTSSIKTHALSFLTTFLLLCLFTVFQTLDLLQIRIKASQTAMQKEKHLRIHKLIPPVNDTTAFQLGHRVTANQLTELIQPHNKESSARYSELLVTERQKRQASSKTMLGNDCNHTDFISICFVCLMTFCTVNQLLRS